MMPKALGGVVCPELLVYGQSSSAQALRFGLISRSRDDESPRRGCIDYSDEYFPAHNSGLVRSRGKGGRHDSEGSCEMKDAHCYVVVFNRLTRLHKKCSEFMDSTVSRSKCHAFADDWICGVLPRRFVVIGIFKCRSNLHKSKYIFY